MSVGIIDFSKRLYSLYRPYFSFAAKKRWMLIAIALIIGCNIGLAISFSFLNASFTTLVAVLELETLTYTAFFSALGVTFSLLALDLIISKVKEYFLEDLIHAIAYKMNMNLFKRWVKSKAFYGIKFLPKKTVSTNEDEEDVLNPAQIISYDTAELIDKVTFLLDNFLNVIFLSLAGIATLYILSVPLVFTVYSVTITIPGYMALAAFAYAFIYNFVTEKIGEPLKDLEKKIRNEQAILYRKAHEIVQYSESIAFLKGEEHELKSLKFSVKAMYALKRNARRIRLSLSAITTFSLNMNFIVPIILSVPNFIAKRMTVAALWEMVPNFQSILRLLTFKNEKYTVLASSEVALLRIEKMNNLIEAWETLLAQSEKNRLAHHVEKNGDNEKIIFERITMNKPDGKTIFQNVHLTLTRGKATLIQGDSGAGKTTLIRAIADLWPYLQKGGQIIFPDESLKVEFIPQQSFVYHKGTSLLDTILYPHARKVSEEEIAEIKKLMRKMSFKPETIRDLEKVKDWNQLSGGEKQRIAIIGAILKKPDVLFMDEATCSNDHKTKAKIEKILKKRLPHSAIGYVDHNPSDEWLQPERQYIPSNFGDYRFNIETGKVDERPADASRTLPKAS